jgi:hypothetical protein
MDEPHGPLLRPLPLRENRAVGGPVPLRLLAAFFGLGLAGWLAATCALVAAAPALARGDPGAAAPVLAVHLLALGFLPLAVSGASFHLLPVMLRNPIRHERLLRAAPPLLAFGAWLLAPGIAFDRPAATWPGAALVSAGFAIVAGELGGIVLRAPRGRTLIASRVGVSLSLFHALAALTLGALVFGHGDRPLGGVSHDRWLLVHLHLAALGWLALLILAVGRMLAPMLALAPAAPSRRLPHDEAALTAGLWLLLAGLAASNRPLAFAGGAVVVGTLARFGALVLRVLRSRRAEPEGPLLHLVAGSAFLAQAAVLGFVLLAGAGPAGRGVSAYVVLLLVGWAAGVTLGHVPKLLSLSLWVWWPPGPRPKQAALYPRRLAQVETAAFAAGVETLAVSVLAGSPAGARAGASLLVVGALLACVATAAVYRSRSGRRTALAPG